MKLAHRAVSFLAAAALLSAPALARGPAAGASLAQDTEAAPADGEGVSGAAIAGIGFAIAALVVGFTVGGDDDDDDSPTSP